MSKSKKDISGYVFNRGRLIGLKTYTFIFSFSCKINLYIRGIQFGSGIRFIGPSHFSRAHKSRIWIGNKCSFRSGYFANRMGINKKCFLATLRPGAELTLGDNAGLSGAVVTCAGKVNIGNNVMLGAGSFITDFDWHGIEPDKRNSPPKPREVVIEDNVWLGFNAVVLKGVRIGKNSVIGANSVVTKDIPANVIAAGNPCKVIKKI